MTWAELVAQPRPEMLSGQAGGDMGGGELEEHHAHHHHHHAHHHHQRHELPEGHELVQLHLQQQQQQNLLAAALQQQAHMGFGIGDMVHPELQVQPLNLPSTMAMQAARLQQVRRRLP
jgi:hypothetical protein